MANDVATRDKTAGELDVKVRNRMLELVESAPVDTGDDGKLRLLDRLIGAETIDDAAAIFDKMDSTRDMLGVPLMIDGFMLRESDYESDVGLPFYATIFARHRETNDEITFNSGATSVVVTLLVANKRGWFPFTAHFESKDLKTGFTVYNLIFDK